ncbi:MAG: hypothetical protein HY096_08675 [Nitrospinae bacterium]|nr:hypothetical protein [Nitrospinota bacterium]
MSKNHVFGHEVMSKPRIIEDREIELEGQDIHEFLASDIENWIQENRAVHTDKSEGDFKKYLADKLDISTRQLDRYLVGATEISIKKAILLCNEIGLKGIFEYANYQLGLNTCELPSIPVSECNNYDAAEELIKNVKAFSEQAVILAKSLNEKPSHEMLQKIKNAALAAIKQILKCERFYAEMLKQKALAEVKKREETRQKRIQKAREVLERAGQGALFK